MYDHQFQTQMSAHKLFKRNPSVIFPMGKSKKEQAKFPSTSVSACHELKTKVPPDVSDNFSDVVSYLCLAISSFGVYAGIGAFLWASLFVLMTLFINRPYNTSSFFHSSFVVLGFNCFLVYIYYYLVIAGLREC